MFGCQHEAIPHPQQRSKLYHSKTTFLYCYIDDPDGPGDSLLRVISYTNHWKCAGIDRSASPHSPLSFHTRWQLSLPPFSGDPLSEDWASRHWPRRLTVGLTQLSSHLNSYYSHLIASCPRTIDSDKS